MYRQVYMYVYIYIYTYTRVHVCIIYIYIYIHMYIHHLHAIPKSRGHPLGSPGFFGTPTPGAHGTPQGAAQTGLGRSELQGPGSWGYH